MNASETPVVRPTPSAAAAVVAALQEASRAGPPVSLQWPYGLLAYRPRPREITVRVSAGEISLESPDGYRVSARDVSVEVKVPMPSRSSIGVA